MRATYLDSSALVKLAAAEPESNALRRYLRRRDVLVSSALARTELARALLPRGEAGSASAQATLERLQLVRVNDRVLKLAGSLQPPELRSLDAIHLATALMLGSDLSAVITYDDRMASAGAALGLKVAAPG